MRLGYRPALDELRGVAVALVLLGHIWFFDHRFGGPIGVAIFFTLSGFLITKLLLEEREATGAVNLTAFYRRRARRLLPALPPVLAVAAMINAAHGWEVARPLAASASYWQNVSVAQGHTEGAFGHLWSLSMEEQFYAAWPLLVLLVPALTLRRAALASLPVLLALRLMLAGSDLGTFLGSAGFSKADQLLAGCALAWVLHARSWRPHPTVLAVAAGGVAGLVWFGMVLTERGQAVAFSFVTVSTCAWIAWAAGRAGGTCAPLGWLGRRSYAVYLWHVPMIWLIDPHLDRGATGAALVIAATLVAAEASWVLIERNWLTRPSPASQQEATRRYRACQPHPSQSVRPGSPGCNPYPAP